MADRSIGELVAASQIGSTDLLVMEQGGTAKKVTGQLLENWLLQMAQGRGGIQTIEKTGTSGITDTYTITFSDESTTTFEVENGRGITGMTSSKTGTVTTVTLSYNDGTTSQFTVNDGEGVTEVVPYWAVSTSKTTQPTSWSSTPQSLTATYKYLWNYLRVNYSDGSHQDTTPTVVGAYGDKGTKGDTGTSITSVTKIGTSGLVDTYRITFSNNTTTTFTITNGSSISTIERTSTSGLVDTYTVTLTNGETETFTVTNGKGISSITQISGSHAAGTSDTYRITYNDGDTYDFLVYNGANGTGAVSSVAGIGVSGSSGDVPLILWGNGAPTATTVGQEKQLYFDLSGGVMYICIGVAAGSYSWASMGITVDSALSSSSNNPVQNRIITQKVGTEALDGFTATTLSGAANELMTKKANKTATVSDVTYDSQNHRLRKTVNGTASTVLEVDTTPTGNSMNPISSDAVAALNGAISGVAEATQSAIAIIANGNTHATITKGQYVYIKNHATLAEGLYKALASTPADVAITASSVVSVPNGVANAALEESSTEVVLSNKNVNAQITKIGRFCFLESNQDFSSLANGIQTIGTIPSGFRPARYTRFGILNKTASQEAVAYYGTIYTTGNIEIYWGGSSISSATNGAFNLLYLCEG